MKLQQVGPKTLPGDGRSCNAHVEELLNDWHQRVYAAQSAHYARIGFGS